MTNRRDMLALEFSRTAPRSRTIARRLAAEDCSQHSGGDDRSALLDKYVVAVNATIRPSRIHTESYIQHSAAARTVLPLKSRIFADLRRMPDVQTRSRTDHRRDKGRAHDLLRNAHQPLLGIGRPGGASHCGPSISGALKREARRALDIVDYQGLQKQLRRVVLALPWKGNAQGHLDMIVLAALSAARSRLRRHRGTQAQERRRVRPPGGDDSPVLHRLEQAGLLAGRWVTPIPGDGGAFMRSPSAASASSRAACGWERFSEASPVCSKESPWQNPADFGLRRPPCAQLDFDPSLRDACGES